MECTIGWIKIKDGFILFKNRDRKKEEPKENFLYKNKEVITFEDRKYVGCWIGINKYGIGVVSSAGPSKDVLDGYISSEEGFFNVNREVLLKSKNLKEVTQLYIKIFKELKLGESFNIIICDKKQANILELISNQVNIQTNHRDAFRTNNFETMREYNISNQRTKRSGVRLKKLLALIKDIKDPKDLIPILSYHSENNNENICRHDSSTTSGSAIIKYQDNEINTFYLLNISPCEGKYKEETFSF